jgi:uncharacterized membrane protein YczE
MELKTKTDLPSIEADLLALKAKIHLSFVELRHAIEIQTLQLTLRFGAMLAVGVVVLAVILKHK